MSRNDASLLKVVVPARYASSRLPAKPLVDLAGVPMIVRVWRRVTEALPEAEVIVATDDSRIADVLDQHAVPWVMTDTAHASGTDRIAEVARSLKWADETMVINVQGDEPLLPTDFLQAFALFCHDGKVTMATVAVPVDDQAQIFDPNIVKLVVDGDNRVLTFSRSAIPYIRDIPPAQWPVDGFLRHVGIYAYRNSVLQQISGAPACAMEINEKLEQLRALWIGMTIYAMQWHEPPPHGVDTPADVERVNRILSGGV